MGKRLFLFVLIGLMGLANTSGILTAADAVKVTGLNDAKAVETVALVEPEPEPEVIYAPAAGYAPVTPLIANYTVTVYSADIIADGLSYYDIYKTGMLVYGHNSSNLLGSLSNRYEGEIFTVTEGGVATNYRVAVKIWYNKTADGYLEGDPYLMGDIVDTAMNHSIALMTCAGVSYGNGDASQRLVVYADRV